MPESLKRTSSGTFAVAPLLNLLLLALDRKLSGTLVLETQAGGKTLIALNGGAVCNLKPAGPVVRLGELLVELAGVHETTVELAASTKSGPRLLGQKLVDAGVIDATMLETTLREQLMRRTLWAGRLPTTTLFHYFENTDLLKDWGNGPVTIDPLALLWQYIKINATNQEVDSALERLGPRDLKLHTRAKVQRFGFGSKVQGALDVLRVRPQSLDVLLAAKLLDADTLKRAVYTLAVTRHLDLGREDLEPMSVAAAESKYPAPRVERRARRRFEPVRPKQDSSPQEPAKVAAGVHEELQALQEKLDSLTYYELLGVPTDATVSMIQSAFLGQAKKWHPDKWRGEQASSRDEASRIFGRISEAHQVLINEEQRKEYDRLRKSKGQEAQEQETVRQVFAGRGCVPESPNFSQEERLRGGRGCR